MIALVQGQRPDTGTAVGLQRHEGDPLDGTVSCDHHQILFLVELPGDHHGGDILAGFQRQDIDDGGTPGSPAGFGDLVTLPVVDTAHIREEQHMVVGRGNVQTLHIVLFLQILGADATAAAALGPVGIHGHPLDIALLTQGKGAGLLFDQILNVDLVGNVLDLGLALVAELVPDLDDLLPEHGLELHGIGQQLLVISDLHLQLVELSLELFPVEALESLQTHIQDGLGLDIIQTETIHQALLGVVVGRADNADDFVDIILGDEQTFQQMGPLLGFTQVIPGPAGQNIHLVGQILVDDLPQGQNFRLLLVIHQRQHDDAEAGLQGSLVEQVVQYNLGVGIFFQFDDDTHTVPVRLVPQVRDAL